MVGRVAWSRIWQAAAVAVDTPNIRMVYDRFRRTRGEDDKDEDMAAQPVDDKKLKAPKSNRLAAVVTAWCSHFRRRVGGGMDHDGLPQNDVPPRSAPSRAVDLSGAPHPDDPGYEEFATLVLRRLEVCDESTALADPQRLLLGIAQEVAAQWARSATRGPSNSDDAAAARAALERAVANLDPACRAVLLANIKEDLNYRQVAERFGLSPIAALARLRTAYCELRLSL
jgi:DNA-directed RNA polymerase specialized sigma24 family protein